MRPKNCLCTYTQQHCVHCTVHRSYIRTYVTKPLYQVQQTEIVRLTTLRLQWLENSRGGEKTFLLNPVEIRTSYCTRSRLVFSYGTMYSSLRGGSTAATRQTAALCIGLAEAECSACVDVAKQQRVPPRSGLEVAVKQTGWRSGQRFVWTAGGIPCSWPSPRHRKPAGHHGCCPVSRARPIAAAAHPAPAHGHVRLP